MLDCSITVYTSDADTPPCRKDKSVKKLCEISYDVGLKWDDLKIYTGKNGKTYRKTDTMYLTMSFDGEVKWALKAGSNTVEKAVAVEYRGSR